MTTVYDSDLLKFRSIVPCLEVVGNRKMFKTLGGILRYVLYHDMSKLDFFSDLW